MAGIGRREQEILTAIVETYISTGEPVGSRTLARRNREGLSAATIRNVMADLAEAGLLAQPHTSSGRVPSVEGYRYYAERLSGDASLKPDDELIIQRYFHGVNEVQEFMERTSHVLSLISSGVGVAITSAGPRNALEHVHFQRLAGQRVLAIVVTRSGVVRDRVLRMARDVDQGELDLTSRYINDNFRGWMIEDVRRELERRIEQERSEYDRLMLSLAELYKSGALAAQDDAEAEDRAERRGGGAGQPGRDNGNFIRTRYADDAHGAPGALKLGLGGVEHGVHVLGVVARGHDGEGGGGFGHRQFFNGF